MTYAVAGAPQVMISEAQDVYAWEEGVVEVLVNPGGTSLTSFAWGTGGEWDTLAFPAPLTQVFEVAGENEVIASASMPAARHRIRSTCRFTPPRPWRCIRIMIGIAWDRMLI